MRSAIEYPFSVRIENAVAAYFDYIGRLLWPVRLAPMYPHPGDSLRAWQIGLLRALVGERRLLFQRFLSLESRGCSRFGLCACGIGLHFGRIGCCLVSPDRRVAADPNFASVIRGSLRGNRFRHLSAQRSRTSCREESSE